MNFMPGRSAGNGGSSQKPLPLYSYDTSPITAVDEDIEREHMFDKVVTPSDVGKLNRLVIPKQHAEKYFPLDSSTSDKGLLLNFEDRNGKPWRFRYSYWNSSQSYVMTKGWSRFVKDKKLDAGDVVSFQRGVGALGKDRLFIDWRRRLDTVEFPPSFPTFQYPLFYPQNPIMYLRSGGGFGMQRGGNEEMVIHESVPVVQGKAAAKRLRLFGVNMDCPISESDQYHPHSPDPSLHLSLPYNDDKGKGSRLG